MTGQEITVSHKIAEQMITNCKGNQFFTVIFVKRGDGSLRKINCRKGVKKNVEGTGLKFNPGDKGLVGVFDMKANEHRFISLDDIREIRMRGQRYTIQQENNYVDKMEI